MTLEVKLHVSVETNHCLTTLNSQNGHELGLFDKFSMVAQGRFKFYVRTLALSTFRIGVLAGSNMLYALFWLFVKAEKIQSRGNKIVGTFMKIC